MLPPTFQIPLCIISSGTHGARLGGLASTPTPSRANDSLRPAAEKRKLMLEAGYFPGVAFYLSMWYRRSEHALRIAVFFSMATFAGAFGGILAYGIGFMRNVGGYVNGWHWIFILGNYILEFD